MAHFKNKIYPLGFLMGFTRIMGKAHLGEMKPGWSGKNSGKMGEPEVNPVLPASCEL
jgi:hypothetical protein